MPRPVQVGHPDDPNTRKTHRIKCSVINFNHDCTFGFLTSSYLSHIRGLVSYQYHVWFCR